MCVGHRLRKLSCACLGRVSGAWVATASWWCVLRLETPWWAVEGCAVGRQSDGPQGKGGRHQAGLRRFRGTAGCPCCSPLLPRGPGSDLVGTSVTCGERAVGWGRGRQGRRLRRRAELLPHLGTDPGAHDECMASGHPAVPWSFAIHRSRNPKILQLVAFLTFVVLAFLCGAFVRPSEGCGCPTHPCLSLHTACPREDAVAQGQVTLMTLA